MYEINDVKRGIELDSINKELLSLEKSYNTLLIYFKRKDLPIIVDMEKLLQGKQEEIIEPLNNIDKYFNLQLNNFNRILPIYINKQKKQEELNKAQIPFVEYKYILRRFNELLTDAILYEAYEFYELFLGKLTVIATTSKRQVIDWGISTRNKNKLIEEGKIPYLKADAEKAKEQGIEYHGVKWIDYLKGIRLYYDWELKNVQFIRIPNIKDFSFIPYNGNGSAIVKLTTLRKSLTDEELINKYKRNTDAN